MVVYLLMAGIPEEKVLPEDKVKMNSAQLLGWVVIEATTAQVKSGDMLVWISKAIAKRNNDASN